MENTKLKEVHSHSINNYDEISKSTMCGCFSCKKIFTPNEVKNWIKDKNGKTAMCPYCMIDSVIGNQSGYSINSTFLNEINKNLFK